AGPVLSHSQSQGHCRPSLQPAPLPPGLGPPGAGPPGSGPPVASSQKPTRLKASTRSSTTSSDQGVHTQPSDCSSQSSSLSHSSVHRPGPALSSRPVSRQAASRSGASSAKPQPPTLPNVHSPVHTEGSPRSAKQTPAAHSSLRVQPAPIGLPAGLASWHRPAARLQQNAAQPPDS